MKILIIGASSYLGARLYTDLKKDFNVIGTCNSNKLFKELIHLDITDRKEISELIARIKPQVILHCANLPKAELMIKNPGLAKKINLDGTEYIVNAANRNNSKVIFISTIGSLLDNDLYTSYKLASENITKKVSSGWLILRPAYILGYSPNTENDRPFNRIYKNVVEKTPAVYDISWKTQSSYIGQIVEIIKICLERNIWNETIPISVSEVKSRYEMGLDILKNFNIKVTPVDKRDNYPTILDDQSILKRLNLPVYSYSQIIQKIIEEIHFQSGL